MYQTNEKKEKGITLVALVVTIVVLLILAGITINYVMGDNGIFKQASNAKLKTDIAKAREKLETTFTQAKIFKKTDKTYNQNGYLDELMKKEIPNIKIIEDNDIVIVDGHAFEIDRSEPKIGEYIGEGKELVFPEINATATVADDKRTANIHITAKEEKNGISKIEIICDGHVIEEYTYDNKKEPITEEYEVKQNGSYTIKAYAKLTEKALVEVDGIVMSLKYTPNGNEEYKKEHQVKVSVNETDDKVKSIKYQWLNTTAEPAEASFTITCNNEETVTKNGVTGTYYLWTLLETEKGKKRIERSEGFNFDNAGPTVTLTSSAISYSSFKLNVTAQDQQSGLAEYEFFVGGVSKGKTTVDGIKESNSQELTVTNATYGNNSCYVVVKDKLGNTTRKDITAQTLMDTTGPTISSFTATKSSATAIALSATARDTGTGVTKFEFYIDNVLKGTETCTATTSSVTKSKTITGLSTGSHTCKVIVYDAKSNSNNKSVSGTTKLYTWEKWNYIETYVWTYSTSDSKASIFANVGLNSYIYNSNFRPASFCNSNGCWFASNLSNITSWKPVVGSFVLNYTASSSFAYKVNSELVCESTSGEAWIASKYNVYLYKTTSTKKVDSCKKGTTQYSDVTSTSSSTYPNNAKSGSYWYVYKGAY